MTRGRNHDSIEAMEKRLRAWRAVSPDDPDFGVLALKVIPELEADIASAKADRDHAHSPE